MDSEKCQGFNHDDTCCTYLAVHGKYCGRHYEKYDENAPLPPIGSDEYENRLVIKFPEIAKEWDFVKNEGLNINGFPSRSNQNVWWICPSNGCSYEETINNRTRKQSPAGCKECTTDLRRVHDKDELQALKDKKNINTTVIGDDTEEFVVDLLKSSKKYKNVEKIGQIGGKADILITHKNDSFNYIQVKTINPNKTRKDAYTYTNDKKYPENMLIVMVNKDRTRYAVDFYKNIPKGGLTLYFSAKRSKYLNIMFKNRKNFLKRLAELIPLSCTENKIGEHKRLEYEMFLRFKIFCDQRGLVFRSNSTDSNPVDCFVNGFRCQLKYTTQSKSEHKYKINSTKKAGRLNGKRVTKPYELDDFDFFIIEIGGTDAEPNKYKGNFCIIPKNVSLERNLLKTSTCTGKTQFTICSPDYEKSYWSKDLWNNASLIPAKKLKLVILKA